MNLKKISLVIVLFVLSGCAAQINEVTRESLKPEKVVAQSIFLDVTSSDSLSQSKNLSDSIAKLKTLISKNFNGNILLKNSSNSNGMALKVTFEHYRHVSGFGRFMAGAMVGDAELRLNVRIVDLSTNQVIRESTLDTGSEFSEGIFGATTSRQLEAMSKKIVSFISSTKTNS